VALKNIIDPRRAEAELAGWLERELPDAVGIRVTDIVIPKSSGLSAETVMFTASYLDGGRPTSERMVARVIKEDPSAGLYMVYDLAKEAAVMHAYRAYTDVPAPEVVQIEADASVLGGPFLVTRAVEGRIPPDDPPYTAEGWVLDLPAERQALLHDNALAMLAKIHDADPRELGLDAIVPEDAQADLLGHDIASWRRAYEWSHGGTPVPVLEAAWAWIDAHRPLATPDLRVSWGDARFGNMIFGEDLQVLAVLDWEQMTLGPRELDLSWWTVVSYRHHGAAQGHEIPPGFPSYEEIIAHYTDLTGYEPRDMDFYDVYSAVRLSVLAVRAATMLIEAGVLPSDSPMAHNNPTTDIVIDLLGLPKPETAGDYYMGKRR
jgi:aminoglycoside phosphotransferase (APT) family kinase protein